MKTTIINNNHSLILQTNNDSNKQQQERQSGIKPFILSNTEEVTMQQLEHDHIIPVFVKDNEPLISHYDFIEIVWEVASFLYGEENLAVPAVRVSHPIKGRIPEAKNKPASELLEHEKTLYYERMMFAIEIPTSYTEVGGDILYLTVGGVKAYNLDCIYNKKGSPEHFKVFVGFKNTVCCNLCISTDGLMEDIRVTTGIELRNRIDSLLCRYNAMEQLRTIKRLPEYYLTESQFAQLIGRCRMYQHLPFHQKKNIPELKFGDAQINQVSRDYYKDESFCRDESGNISLWKLYNLLTSSNKSSYLDMFLPRAANASSFVQTIANDLEQRNNNWFLI